MNILVTGASGFSGEFIVRELVSRGHKVIAHIGSGGKRDSLVNIKGVIKILDNSNGIEFWPKNINAIVHAAAYSPHNGLNLDKVVESNIIFTHSLVRYAQAVSPKLIIFLSSISIYGDIFSPILDSKSQVNNPDLYGVSKLMSEKIIEASRIPSIAIRLPGIVGPNSVRNWLTILRQKAIAGEDIEIYNANNLFNNVIHIKDLAEFICQLLEKKYNQFIPIIIGTSDPVQIEEVVRKVMTNNNSVSKLVERVSAKSSFLINCESAIKLGYSPKSTIEVIDKFSRGL